MTDDNNTEENKKLSPKEYARQQRRKAYLAAKEKRKTDPVHLALKEKQKQQRREIYQKQKAYIASKKKDTKQTASKIVPRKDSFKEDISSADEGLAVPKVVELSDAPTKQEKLDLLRSKLRLIDGGKDK